MCVCFSSQGGQGLGWTVEGWSASDPWEWNAFPFVALQFLTGLLQHMSMMGLFLLFSFPDPQPSSPHSSPPLTVPKAIGIPGGHQRSSFRRKACWLLGGLLCRSSKGRRQCLINWLGVLGRVQEFAEGGDRKSGDEGWAERDGGAERAGQSHSPPMEIHWPLSQIYFRLIYIPARRASVVVMGGKDLFCLGRKLLLRFRGQLVYFACYLIIQSTTQWNILGQAAHSQKK